MHIDIFTCTRVLMRNARTGVRVLEAVSLRRCLRARDYSLLCT